MMRSPQFNSRARRQAEQAAETAAGLRQMLQLAEQGRLIGGAGTMIDSRHKTHEYALGFARDNRSLAHYGATRLAAMLLWPDDHFLPGSVSEVTE
jgi:hypothetical protein